MIAFFFCPSANRTAGTRYASDLPTPVPASTTRCRSSSSACATRAAISCCGGRNSKFFAFDRGPFGEKNARTRSTNSLPRVFFSAITSENRHKQCEPRARTDPANTPCNRTELASQGKYDRQVAESARPACGTDHSRGRREPFESPGGQKKATHQLFPAHPGE